MVVGSFLGGYSLKDPKPLSTTQADQYPLLAKRVFLENRNDVLINFAPLRSALELYFSRLEGNYSFYFEYLFTGTSIRQGSTDDSTQVGASLLKIPLAMDLYKAEELGRIDLDKEVTIKQEWLNQEYGDLWKKGAGTKITLREAADLTLKDSDNTAARVVLESLVGVLSEEESAFSALDIEYDVTDDSRITINARAYASFLKCLYLSCYLTPEGSHAILKKLNEAPEVGRIAAGVPDDVPVAHKIGTFSNTTQSDCGIVYAPNRPYLLCIMMDGSDETTKEHFQRISELIYNYVTDTAR